MTTLHYALVRRQTLRQAVELEQGAHEGNLIEANSHEPEDEVLECTLREISATVQVALAGGVGMIHHPFVICFSAARKELHEVILGLSRVADNPGFIGHWPINGR